MGIVIKRSLPALLIALLFCPPAAARASEQPRVEVKTPGDGLIRSVTVRLTDPESGAPIDGAAITAIATMTKPHLMSMPPLQFRPEGGGRYVSRVQFEMRTPWTVTMRVTGRNFAPLFSTFVVDANAPSPDSRFRLVSPQSSDGDGWILAGLFVSIAVAVLGTISAFFLWRRQRPKPERSAAAAPVDGPARGT
jgi:hypothetical protein